MKDKTITTKRNSYYHNGKLDMSAPIKPPSEEEEVRHMAFKCATKFKVKK